MRGLGLPLAEAWVLHARALSDARRRRRRRRPRELALPRRRTRGRGARAGAGGALPDARGRRAGAGGRRASRPIRLLTRARARAGGLRGQALSRRGRARAAPPRPAGRRAPAPRRPADRASARSAAASSRSPSASRSAARTGEIADAAVPLAEDRRGPPHERVRQARRVLARRGGRGGRARSHVTQPDRTPAGQDKSSTLEGAGTSCIAATHHVHCRHPRHDRLNAPFRRHPPLDAARRSVSRCDTLARRGHRPVPRRRRAAAAAPARPTGELFAWPIDIAGELAGARLGLRRRRLLLRPRPARATAGTGRGRLSRPSSSSSGWRPWRRRCTSTASRTTDSPSPPGRGSTALAPLGLPLLYLAQRRGARAPVADAPLPARLRIVMIGVGGAVLLAGLLAFAAPQRHDRPLAVDADAADGAHRRHGHRALRQPVGLRRAPRRRDRPRASRSSPTPSASRSCCWPRRAGTATSTGPTRSPRSSSPASRACCSRTSPLARSAVSKRVEGRHSSR